MINDPLLLDSITDAGESAGDRVVICGSHGGLYPAAVASAAQVRAVVFNDAGIGLDKAGVAGVLALADTGMAAAAADCQTCRIGSAKDTAERGRISVANSIAAGLGVASGMPVQDAVALLDAATAPVQQMVQVPEARKSIRVGPGRLLVHLLDSASLVGPEDAGQIVVTGSHGGLIGGDASRALKADACLAVFNDAGFGIEDVGVGRLPALDKRHIAAVTVSCDTARIGDAESAVETGLISSANAAARAMGARPGDLLCDVLAGLG